jgi:ABC-2 type transport system permease protein
MKWGIKGMLSKISFFNRGIFIQSIRNVGWIAIIYFLGLLFALPIHILMMYIDENWFSYYHSKHLFAVSSGIQFLLMFIIPILLAVFLFRYMQVKLSADYIHSLPLKRESLFHQHVFVGASIIIVPVVAIAIIIALLQPAFSIDLFSMKQIIEWTLWTIIIDLFFYFGTVFVGMFTGMSVLQGIFAYILFLFPAGMIVLFTLNLKYFLYGFAYDYYLSQKLENLVPFIRVTQLISRPFQPLEMSIYIVLIVVFYGVSIWLYKKRHIEAATDAIAFRSLQPVFKYGFTFCVMLVGGLYFGEMQGDIRWTIFGYIFASLIGYFIAEMILEKTWRVFARWKGYVGYSLVIIAIGLLLKADITGYEKRIPSLADIERAYFGDSIYYFENNEEGISPFFYQKENIENIYLFHQQLIKDWPKVSFQNDDRDLRNVVIGYDLKNGKRIVRSYTVPVEPYKNFYAAIVESKEYKQNYYPLLRVHRFDDVLQVSISSSGKMVQLRDRKQIDSFLATVQQELENETFESLIYLGDQWGDIEVLWTDNKRMNIPWKKSYDRLDSWLKENHLLDKARMTAKDIRYAIVFKNKEKIPVYEWQKEMIVQEGNGWKITDKAQIEQCLRASSWEENADYIVAFFYENDSIDIQAFRNDQIPPFILEHFR